jgi:hypothetical protein
MPQGLFSAFGRLATEDGRAKQSACGQYPAIQDVQEERQDEHERQLGDEPAPVRETARAPAVVVLEKDLTD